MFYSKSKFESLGKLLYGVNVHTQFNVRCALRVIHIRKVANISQVELIFSDIYIYGIVFFFNLTLIEQLSNCFRRILCPIRRITIAIIAYNFDTYTALLKRMHRKSCISMTSFDTHNNTRTICMGCTLKPSLISSVLEDIEEPPPAHDSAGIQKQFDAFYSVWVSSEKSFNGRDWTSVNLCPTKPLDNRISHNVRAYTSSSHIAFNCRVKAAIFWLVSSVLTSLVRFHKHHRTLSPYDLIICMS